MQSVILAAGKGTRMRPLTNEKPKPLVEVAGTPIIEHVVQSLPDEIEELVIVIGYKGEQIKDYIGDEFYGRAVQYVEQREKKGTAHALFQCKQYLSSDKFLKVNADDLLGKNALKKALHHDLCLLTYRHEYPERFGVVHKNDEGFVEDIIEKPENPPSDHVNTGASVLDQRIFSYDLPPQKDGEHYLSDLIKTVAQDHKVAVVEDPHWHPVGYPDDIPKAEEHLRKILKRN